MENYKDIMGVTFRKVRESRDISLRAASKGVLSKSQLSRFEKNESQIKASALFQLLENIGASPEEFFYIMRQFESDNFSRLFHIMGIYEQESNWSELKKIYSKCIKKYQETLNLNFRIQAISIKAILYGHKQIENLSKNETEFTIKLLYDNLNWGLRELRLFNCTLAFLPYSITTELLEDILKRSSYYSNIAENRQIIIMILRGATWNSLTHRDFQHALQYRGHVKEIAALYSDYFAWMVLKQLAYSYEKEKGNLERASQELEEYVVILKNLGNNYEAESCEEELNKLKKEIKKLRKNGTN
ncbi:Rgg/GadR/MutR family transcriptional regulator [Lactovum odontotermitis]